MKTVSRFEYFFLNFFFLNIQRRCKRIIENTEELTKELACTPLLSSAAVTHTFFERVERRVRQISTNQTTHIDENSLGTKRLLGILHESRH
jgi:hypothetical protein